MSVENPAKCTQKSLGEEKLSSSISKIAELQAPENWKSSILARNQVF
jgi:hypothetical protein